MIWCRQLLALFLIVQKHYVIFEPICFAPPLHGCRAFFLSNIDKKGFNNCIFFSYVYENFKYFLGVTTSRITMKLFPQQQVAKISKIFINKFKTLFVNTNSPLEESENMICKNHGYYHLFFLKKIITELVYWHVA